MSALIGVPLGCLPLLSMQRTHYGGDPARAYSAELEATYEQIRPFLPATATRILDIGCGLAGIDVLLARHYDQDVELVLLDREGTSFGPQGGYRPEGIAKYHSQFWATMLLGANGVTAELRHVDIDVEPFPCEHFDVAISLLSWGFHYPISTYRPHADVIVADVRRGTTGMDELAELGNVRVVHTARKYDRVVVC